VASLDLRPEWLDIIRKILATHLPEAEVIAYGSRVTGTAHEGSDLDLVTRNLSNPLLPVRNLGEIRDRFSESNLPILVDILDWAQIPDSFRNEIELGGVVISPDCSGKQR
jgi:predicted nucleotidyltransferase